MDMMSMVSGMLAAQAGNTQMQVATTLMKSNADAEKSAVLTLLGISGTTYAVGKGITATDPTRMNKVNPPPHAAAHVPPAAPAAPIAPAPGAPAAAVPPVANQ